MTTTTRRTKDMVLIALFAATIAICAWISIPTTVPFTMQTFGVFLALGVLGGRRGGLASCGLIKYMRGGLSIMHASVFASALA